MMINRLLLTTFIAITLTGCASDPLTGEPSVATSIAHGLVGMAVRGATENRKISQCADQAQQSGKTSREEALSICRQRVQAQQRDEQQREAREAREKAEALQQAFNQRKEHEDTTSVIEKQVARKSWIEQHETPPRPVIAVDPALGVD